MRAGVDASHADIAANLHPLIGYNPFTRMVGAAAVADGHGHGTHVAGTMNAVQDNHMGITGMAGSNVSMLACKAFFDDGTVLMSSFVDCFNWCVVDGCLPVSVGRPRVGAARRTRLVWLCCSHPHPRAAQVLSARRQGVFE